MGQNDIYDGLCRLGGCGFVLPSFLTIPSQGAIHVGAYPLLVEKLRVARVPGRVEFHTGYAQSIKTFQ